jgi:hypothetical protein
VQATQKAFPPAHRRTGFEVAGWDGARWILEGVFDSGAEAASQAKLVLARRHGVRVTEEVFNAAEGVFKSRVVFTEFRGPEPQAPSAIKKKPDAVPPRSSRRSELLAGGETALYLSAAALAVSVLALFFSLVR